MRTAATVNHFCGDVLGKDKCPMLISSHDNSTVIGKTRLRQFHVYCLAEGKCRCLGETGSFTGKSPEWCPKRIKSELEV